jgi:predicted ArsR family transcriptional regulator
MRRLTLGRRRKQVPRKRDILRLISERGGATAREVSDQLGIPLPVASRLLGHYFRQGALTREPKGGGRGRGFRYVYSLTPSGRRRLAYLEGAGEEK